MTNQESPQQAQLSFQQEECQDHTKEDVVNGGTAAELDDAALATVTGGSGYWSPALETIREHPHLEEQEQEQPAKNEPIRPLYLKPQENEFIRRLPNNNGFVLLKRPAAGQENILGHAIVQDHFVPIPPLG